MIEAHDQTAPEPRLSSFTLMLVRVFHFVVEAQLRTHAVLPLALLCKLPFLLPRARQFALVGEVRIERENELKPRRTAAEICQVQIFVNAVAHPPEDRKFQCVLCGRVAQAAPGIGWLLRKIGGPQNELDDARPLVEPGKRGPDARLAG